MQFQGNGEYPQIPGVQPVKGFIIGVRLSVSVIEKADIGNGEAKQEEYQVQRIPDVSLENREAQIEGGRGPEERDDDKKVHYICIPL